MVIMFTLKMMKILQFGFVVILSGLQKFILLFLMMILVVRFFVNLLHMFILKLSNAMKLTANQYNYKCKYYCTWCPILANTTRFDSASWYLVDGIRFDSKEYFLAKDFTYINLNEYHDLYFKRVTLPIYKIEFGRFLHFLLSCTPAMLKRFASLVYGSYAYLYEDASEVLREIDEVLKPYKVKL